MEKSPKEILDKIFAQYHKQFQLEYDRAETLLAVKRIYDAGRALELAFKLFFKSILPEYVGITRGIIFDTNGDKQSKEIDLIFYDKRYFSGFPIIENGEDTFSYISIDVVFGIASVKKTFDFDEWFDSIKNLNSVYSLKRESKKSQFHYDLNFGGSEKGSVLSTPSTDKIFSCIFSAKCKFAYKPGEDMKLSHKELSEAMGQKFGRLQKSNDEKYKPLFIEMPIDLIYTVDGILAETATEQQLDDKAPSSRRYTRELSTNTLGDKKKLLRLIENGAEKPVAYVFNYRLDRPNDALGLVIIYVSYWCSRLVKSSPKTHELLEKYLKSPLSELI
jgi:hypothetical protein